MRSEYGRRIKSLPSFWASFGRLKYVKVLPATSSVERVPNESRERSAMKLLGSRNYSTHRGLAIRAARTCPRQPGRVPDVRKLPRNVDFSGTVPSGLPPETRGSGSGLDSRGERRQHAAWRAPPRIAAGKEAGNTGDGAERVGANAHALERADARLLEARARHRSDRVEDVAVELEVEGAGKRGAKRPQAAGLREHDAAAREAAD